MALTVIMIEERSGGVIFRLRSWPYKSVLVSSELYFTVVLSLEGELMLVITRHHRISLFWKCLLLLWIAAKWAVFPMWFCTYNLYLFFQSSGL